MKLYSFGKALDSPLDGDLAAVIVTFEQATAVNANVDAPISHILAFFVFFWFCFVLLFKARLGPYPLRIEGVDCGCVKVLEEEEHFVSLIALLLKS